MHGKKKTKHMPIKMYVKYKQHELNVWKKKVYITLPRSDVRTFEVFILFIISVI